MQLTIIFFISAQHTIPLCDVIAISNDDSPDGTHFILDFAKRLNNNVWRHRRITVAHTDSRQVTLWIRTIQNHLNGKQFRTRDGRYHFTKQNTKPNCDFFSDCTSRPKRLLLFVNPYGGKRKALKIFEEHGKPLFAIAKVDVSVMISQRANQITDLLMKMNLNMYDAVACVGGDGTFSELFNGLILKACRDKNINPNDPTAEIPPPDLPVGVIPGGSTDTVAYCVHGTNDIQTAVLNIIFGETIGLDLASAFSQDKLIRFYASVMSYGFLGDVAIDSERFRWMGPKRYDYSGLKKILSNTGYDGELRLLCEKGDNDDNTICLENCNRCSTKKEESVSTTDLSQTGHVTTPTCEWKTIRGKFFMVNGANVSCACAKSPNGIAPYCHIGDGCVNLVLVRHTSAFNVLRLLLRLSRRARTIVSITCGNILKRSSSLIFVSRMIFHLWKYIELGNLNSIQMQEMRQSPQIQPVVFGIATVKLLKILIFM